MSTVPNPLVGGAGNPSPVGSQNVGGVITEPTGPQSNSITNFLRSLGTTTASEGTAASTAGSGAFGSGIQSLQPAINFFTKLLGSNEDLQNALSPQFDQISQQFDQIRNSISATQPRGGGTASSFAQAPFQEAAAKGEIAAKARTDAAGQLGQLSTAEAGLGEGEQGLGLQALGESLNEGLGVRGQDFAQQAALQQMFGQIGESIGSALGGTDLSKLVGGGGSDGA